MYRLFYFIILFINCSLVCGQNPNFYTLGEREFTNKDIYSLLYDETSELLYIGTDKGVFKYTSNKFIELKVPAKTIGSSFFDFKKFNGEIFCQNLNGQLFKIGKDSLSIFHENKSESNIPVSYYFINEQIIMVTDCSIKSLHLKNDSIYETNIYKAENNKQHFVYTKNLQEKVYIHFNKNNFFRILDSNIKIIETGHSVQKPIPFVLNNILFYKSLKGNYYTEDGELFQKYKDVNSQVTMLDKDFIVEVNSFGNLTRLELKNDSIKHISLLTNQSISTASLTKSGCLLLGTFKSGIIVVNKPNQHGIGFQNRILTDVVVQNDSNIYVSSNKGEIYQLSNHGKELITENNQKIDRIFYHKDIHKLAPEYTNNLIYSSKNIKSKYSNIKDIVFIDSSLFFYVNSRSLYSNLKKLKSFNNIRCISYSKKNSILFFSRNDQLCSINIYKENSPQVICKGININDMEFSNNKLYCATQNKGLLIIEKNKIIKQISTPQNLNSKYIKKVKINNSKIYILTDVGLQVYDVKKNKMYTIGELEGLNKDAVVSFDVGDKKVWVITKNKAYDIDKRDIFYSYKIGELYFDSVKVNKEKLSFSNKNLKYNDRNIEFYYDYRNIKTKSKVEILYTLEGYFNEWRVVSAYDNKITFESLPTGEYTFKLVAKLGNQQTTQKTYSFIVAPPFWRKWWFYLLTTLLLSGFTYLYFRSKQRRKEKKDKEELEKQILLKNSAKNQLKAIRSQMNPHFIFNSLNSIQHFILKQETDISYDYITLFSKLVRNMLNFSEKEFTPLIEEIEFLNVYLSLEKLRFGDEFNYTIINNVTNQSVQVSSLVIQPFIENCLLHGLLHKEGDKKISLIFNFKNNKLYCTIEDNGIGRKEASKIKERQNRNHESFSTKAIKKRMEILSKKLNQEASFFYEDLYENNIAKGTKVTIVLPYTF